MAGNLSTYAGGGNRWITNPKHLSSVWADKASILVKSTAASSNHTNAAATFTALATRGATASISVADTYATVANLSGAGFAFNFISPTHDGGAFTPTIRITVDGQQYVIAPSSTLATAKRMVLGPICSWIPSISGVSTATVAGDIGGVNSPSDNGFAGSLAGNLIGVSGSIAIPTPESALSFGLQGLRFETSLLVEMKASLLSSTAVDKQCAVTYRMDL